MGVPLVSWSIRRAVAPAAVPAALAALALGGCAASGTPEAARPEPQATLASSSSTTSTSPSADPGSGTCAVTSPALGPRHGIWLGVSIDPSRDTLSSYAARLGHDPATAVTFGGLPMTTGERYNIVDTMRQAMKTHSGVLLTLEPHDGLRKVNPTVATDLARWLARFNDRGVPVFVRFGHEMNGSWYPWGQRPAAYVRAFRRVATAIHADAPGTAMMWAPSYGGGYPFPTGAYSAPAGSARAKALDTNGNGRLDPRDDPYRPYWPGGRYVDWVALSIYHWGTLYPWGENEVPTKGKFVAQLTGTYDIPGADERSVPDFYRLYAARKHKPMGIGETAAFYSPGHGGAPELSIKRAWWRQLYQADLPTRFPRLKMINWFEWNKVESEVNAGVDWTATTTPTIRRAYRADLPSWARWGRPTC